jgi:hypothetical protein
MTRLISELSIDDHIFNEGGWGVFKFHVIHIIDDLKSNYVLHHAIIVHEALITPIASITLSQLIMILHAHTQISQFS